MSTAKRAPTGKSTIAWTALFVITVLLMMTSLYMIFVVAPVELQMGIAQKIFYFHVPSAYSMYVSFGVCGLASAIFLVKRTPASDAWAVAGAEVGMIFTAIVLVTGPLWAYKAWGTFWTWDPRLTTTLLQAMIYAAYLALRSFGAAGEVEKRFAAGLAVLGVPNMFIIHYSVQRWRGQHPTVITAKGGGLDAQMGMALGVSFIAFTALVILLLWTRARIEQQRSRVREVELEAAQRGLLGDA